MSSLQSAEQSAAVALATVAQHHGLPIRPGEIEAMLGLASVSTLGDLVVASRLLGFESVPLEGSYDELCELVVPAIVVLSDASGQERFAVLVVFESASVLLADPIEGGTRRVPREDFCAQWHGDCLQLVPDEPRLALARERLELHRNPGKRLLQALRFTPPRAPKLVFMAAALGLPALAGAGALMGGATAPTLASVALALASLSSLWLALFGASCIRCGGIHRLTGGLPLERVGAVLYSVLLGFALAVPSSSLPACMLLAASGGHLWLLIVLARARTMCWPCLLTAFGAFTATALLVLHTAASLALGAGLFAVGLVGMAVATRFFQRAAEHEALWEARRLALSVLHPNQGDAVRVVVWKRAGCPSCLIYEAVLAPALVQALGDAITIEEHDAGTRPIPSPLILIAGPVPVLFLGLPGTDDDGALLLTAIESARNPALAMVAPLGGIYIVDPHA
jgi:hypothetical protein